MGYLSNSVSRDTGCGSSAYPWLIAASRGQRIKLTLIDFSVYSQHNTSHSIYHNVPVYAGGCQEYVVVEEGGLEEGVCGGRSEVQEVYQSQGHEVRVSFPAPLRLKYPPSYLLQYTGEAR